MKRIQLIVEYDGTAYAGWQRQKNALAVQQVLEEALSRLTRRPVALAGASRTDAGVHALGQSAHFDTDCPIPAEKYAYALNTMLPEDVRVRLSQEVDSSFHARFSAVGKEYLYRMHVAPHASALERRRRWHVIYPLDLAVMRSEAERMLGRHDFAAFAASGSVVRDTVRTVHAVTLRQTDELLEFSIVGGGFLYNMVRILAGTLAQVGSGKLPPGAVSRALETGDRLCLGVTAPAHGLTLQRVYYREEDLRRRAQALAEERP